MQIFKILHDHSGFVRRPRRAVPDCRNKTTWVDVEEALRFLVRIDFDILIGYLLVLQ